VHVAVEKDIVAVTGGAGFIGTHLCKLLIAEGYQVRSLDIRDPRTPVPGVQYLKTDVRDSAALRLGFENVTAVFHFAAIVNVAECQEKPAESYSTNFMGTLHVLEALDAESKRSGAKPRLIFAGSSAVYALNGREGVAIQEADIASEPLSFYAQQKQASEQLVRLYHRHRGIPAVVFRFFNVFGPGQDPKSPYSGVITIFSRLAREGANLPLQGGGSQTRDFISVHDIARANLAALRADITLCDGNAINLGTGRSVTIRYLGELMLRLTRGSGQLQDAPARQGDVPHSLAGIQRATQILKWKPTHSLEQGLEELLC